METSFLSFYGLVRKGEAHGMVRSACPISRVGGGVETAVAQFRYAPGQLGEPAGGGVGQVGQSLIHGFKGGIRLLIVLVGLRAEYLVAGLPLVELVVRGVID